VLLNNYFKGVFMKKTVLVLLVMAMLIPSFAGAQEAGKAENKIFNVQLGLLGGYNLGTEDTGAGRDFCLNITLSDQLQVGFRSITNLIAANSVFLNLSYFLTPQLNLDILVGNDGLGNLAGGIDAGYTIFKGGKDAFTSTLKAKAGYIFEEGNGIGEGAILFGLVSSIGY
jgi:hypothetical protein